MSSLERQLDVAVQQYNAVVKQNKELQKELNTYKKAIKSIQEIVKPIKDNTCFGWNCGAVDEILSIIDEVESE